MFINTYKNISKQAQKHLHKVVAVCIVAAMLGLGIPIVLSSKSVPAATDAYFSLSPSSGSYTVGNTLTVSISETSSASDDTNAVGVDLSFPSSLLTYSSSTLTGPFTLCGNNTHTSSTVSVACVASAAQSGTKAVLSVTFKVKAAGTASVKMTNGTDTGIDNTSGTSVWDGVLRSGSFTLKSATTQSSGGSTGSSGTTSSIPTSSGSTTTKPSTTTTKKKTTAQTATKSTTQPLGSLSITVSDDEGGRLVNALVVLDNQQKSYTNASGIANFAGVKSGNHTVTVTAAGQKQYSATVTLSPGQNKLVTYQLSKATVAPPHSTMPWSAISIVAGVVVLAAAGAAFWYWYFKLGNHALPWVRKAPMMTFPNPDTNQDYYEAVDPSRPTTQPATPHDHKPRFIR